MIIIIGSILTNADNRAAIEAESVAHCARSRAEPGCIAHNVHYDVEAPERLVFVEKWADAPSLLTHFAVPASGAFSKAINALATERPAMQIYTSEEITASELAK